VREVNNMPRKTKKILDKIEIKETPGTLTDTTHFKNIRKPVVEEVVLEGMKDVTLSIEPVGLIAYAPFDYDKRHYEPGDVFNPAGLVLDSDFDTFRAIEKKNAGGEEIGTAFVTKEGRRVILPVKEG
jgi:hypothetical protein